jgi:hypothetical protein
MTLVESGLAVYPISTTSKAYRQRKVPSGNKTDHVDAWSLADALRGDGKFAIHYRKHPAQKQQRADLGSLDIDSQGPRGLWEHQAEFAQARTAWRRWSYYRPAWTPPSTRMFSPVTNVAFWR